MNGSVWVRVRSNTKGQRAYAVIYRRGGRGFPQIHAGTFKTRAAADARLKVVEMDLAFGRDPQQTFAVATPIPSIAARTFDDWFDAWHGTLLDVEASSAGTYAAHRGRLVAAFGGRDLSTITQEEIQDWVGYLLICEKPMKPRSIRQYWITLRSIFEYAKVSPNPAVGVRLPKPDENTLRVITRDEFARVCEHLSEKYVLLYRLLEATGTRISEPLGLVWADVDWAKNRLLLVKTKNGMKRWVDVPESLMLKIAEIAPEEERDPDGRIFADIGSDDAARSDWRKACKEARVEGFTPHSLRHRRISLWMAQGVDVARVGERVGHLDKAMTLDTYTKVVVPDDDEWLSAKVGG